MRCGYRYYTLDFRAGGKVGIRNLGLPDWADFDHKVYLAYPEFSQEHWPRRPSSLLATGAAKTRSRPSNPRAQIEQELENLRRAVREFT